jgi:hypothetical protein
MHQPATIAVSNGSSQAARTAMLCCPFATVASSLQAATGRFSLPTEDVPDALAVTSLDNRCVHDPAQGARAVAVIELADAAWISAAGAGGAMILGTAILWPLMKKRVAAFDAAQAALPTKDVDSGKFADVVEDGWQQRVDDKLKSFTAEVDPNDKSAGAYWQRVK